MNDTIVLGVTVDAAGEHHAKDQEWHYFREHEKGRVKGQEVLRTIIGLPPEEVAGPDPEEAKEQNGLNERRNRDDLAAHAGAEGRVLPHQRGQPTGVPNVVVGEEADRD